MADKRGLNVIDKVIKPPVRQAVAKKKSPKNKLSDNKLELLVTVVNRKKAELFQDFISQYEVNMQLSFKAHGTATVEMLSMLGLEDNQKSVIFSIVKQEKLKDVLSMLEEKFSTIKDGKGIAYTIPLTSVIGVAIFGFLSNNQMTVKEDKNEKV